MHPDSDAGRKRIGYEAKSAALEGRRVQQVRYWDIHNYSTEPREWDHGDVHHAVMGVELLTDRGPLCVLWAGTFFCYGVEIFHTPIRWPGSSFRAGTVPDPGPPEAQAAGEASSARR